MMKKILNMDFKLLGFYLLMLLLAGIIQVVSISIFPEIQNDENTFLTFNALMNLSVYLFLTIGMVLIAKRYLWKNQWVYFKSKLSMFSLLVIMGIFLMFTMNLLVLGLFTLFNVEINPENQQALELIAQSSTLNRLSLFIFAGFLAPIVEELVFRKSIYGMIERKLGVLSAIVFSSFLFGLIHVLIDLSNFIQILPYMGLGLVLGFMYYFSGKMIFVPIFMHMLMNILSVLALLITL